MNRDALLATLIGLGLGLLMTGILIAGPGLLKYLPHFSFPKQITKTVLTPTPTPSQFGVTITSPLAEAIASTSQLVVSGTTFPKSIVVLQGPTDDDVVTVGDDGKYAGKITLSEGRNDIIVTSYNHSKQASQAVTVYYTEENL